MRRLDVTTPTPLSGTLSIEAPATVGEGDGSVSYTVGMVLAEDQQPSANARLSVNVSSSNDVAYAPHDFVAVDDDFTFAGSDFTRVEMPQDSGTYRYVATATGQVALIDDPLVESDESFTLTLSTTTVTEATITASTRQVVIENDDNYGLAVSVNPESIVEGQTADVTVTASVTPEADSCVVGFPISFDLQISGSATATDDYTHDFGDGGSTLSSIRIPPCVDSVEWTMSFAAVLDMSSDPGETIVLTAVDRTGGFALETPSTTTPATVEIQDALAGRFVDSTIPEWHNGTSEFTTQIAFSEDINTSVTDFRHYSLIVTAGDIRNVSLVENRKDLWEIIIRPLGNVDVTVALRTVQGCNTNGAICTADDKQLSNHVETRVRSDAPFPTDLRVISVESDSVELSWETPEYPQWRTLTGYRVYRYVKADQEYSTGEDLGDIPQDSQSTSTAVHFTDSTVESETTYLYRIFANYRDVGLSTSVSTGDVTTQSPQLSGTLSLEVPATVSESDGSVSYTVRMVSAEDRYPFYNTRLPINVRSSAEVARAPDDFVEVDDNFTFTPPDFTRVETPQGSGTYRYVATATGQVTLIDDPLVESDESFTLTLSTTTAGKATIATSTHRVVIEDDDTYGLAVSVDALSIWEGHTREITVTTSVTPEPDSCVLEFPILFDLQFSGSASSPDDYTLTLSNGDPLETIRIPPCTSSVDSLLSLSAVHDTSTDPSETIVFTAVAREDVNIPQTPTTTTSDTVTISGTFVPGPTDVTVGAVSSSSVELNWEPPDYPEWWTLIGYRVYRYVKVGEEYPGGGVGFGNILHDSQSTSTTVHFTDSTVEPETTYLYRVFARYRDAGSSGSVNIYDVTTPQEPLTAEFVDSTLPERHDGSSDFTFELRFSEDLKPDFSYTTVRDHAFTVTGGSVTYVRRLEPGKNVPLGDHRHPQLQHCRVHSPKRHHRLLRPGRHLYRRRQATVPRESRHACRVRRRRTVEPSCPRLIHRGMKK